jgi:hypothetical protein
MRFFAMAAFAVLLSGCAARRAQLAAADDEKCRGYGAQPGTSAYVNCRTQLDATRTTAGAIITGATIASP